MLIDTHCHIHDKNTYAFAISREQISKKLLARNPDIPHKPEDFAPEKLLSRAKAQGIEKIITVGTSPEDSLAARDFANTHENVFYSYGIHPDYAADASTPFIIHERTPTDLVAIGEIGLDYRNGTESRPAQIALLERMLQLATDNNLPCIFHVRDAFEDFFPVVGNFSKLRAVVHSFSDSPENLEKSLSRGFYIGINGLATFANLYPETLPPLSRILLETDAPFLTPVPFRGRVNEPAYIKNIADFLAEKYNLPLAKIAEQTTKNAEALFKI